MQVLASNEGVTANGIHPSDEELAAYIDRRLRGQDRARITEHLASCDRCYAVFSGVVRFQLEEGAEMGESGGGKVIPFDQETRARRWRWWIPTTIAAALALVSVGVAYYLFWRLPVMTAADLVAPVEGREGAAANLWNYSRFRSGAPSTGDGLADAPASVQCGALLVDLRLASQAGQKETAVDLLRAIQRALQGTLYVPEEELTRLIELERALDQPGLKRLLDDLPALEADWEKEAIVDVSYFRLGKWVEAGRLAAELEEPRFFSRRANRAFLESILDDEEMALPEEVRKDLKTIDEAWASKDYTLLAKSFQGILDYYDFRS